MEDNKNEIAKIEQLKKNLYNAINESDLSVASVYYIIKDLFNEIISAYNTELKALKEQDSATAEVVEEKTE